MQRVALCRSDTCSYGQARLWLAMTRLNNTRSCYDVSPVNPRGR
jgi:hypothetical protein